MPDPTPNAPLRNALPWFAAAFVVVCAAITGGLLLAYFVAGGRSADDPGVGAASPTPRRTIAVSLAPPPSEVPTEAPSEQPRRTPTPVPVVTPERSPLVHIIARGESLSYIAGVYCVTIDELIELNGIENPNRIQVDQELLIPGTACQ